MSSDYSSHVFEPLNPNKERDPVKEEEQEKQERLSCNSSSNLENPAH